MLLLLWFKKCGNKKSYKKTFGKFVWEGFLYSGKFRQVNRFQVEF